MKHSSYSNHGGSLRFFDSYTAALRMLKWRSMRGGTWYRVLSRLERVQVDLTIKFVRRVQSPLLARVLDLIIDKLSNALQSRVSRIIVSIGFPLALKSSRIAQGWGNRSAQAWAQDLGYAKFLAIVSLNLNSAGPIT